MRWHVVNTSLVLLLLLPAVGHSLATPVDGDTFTSTRFPDRTFGDAEVLEVLVGGPPANPDSRVGYLHFDLAALPPSTAGTNVRVATLTLYAKSGTPGDLMAYEVLGAWNEEDLTHATSPGLGALVTSTPINEMDSFVTLDITGLVAAWIDDPSQNHGIALSSVGSFTFDTKENQSTAHEPTLDITITDAPPGSIILWDSGPCPTGYTSLDHEGRFLRVSQTAEETGGSTAHSHGSGTYAAPHAHSLVAGIPNDRRLVDDNSGGDNNWVSGEHHTHSLTSEPGTAAAVTGASEPASNLPPYVTMSLCKRDI